MCTKSDLFSITDTVTFEARGFLGDLLDAVILYGSYARGDYDDESDIDIMIRINCPREQLNTYKQLFIRLADKLSLQYGVEISLSLTDRSTYDRYKNHLPYYENIEREGIKIA